MTTFNIDTSPTKYKEILDSIIEQGHALKSIHNPQTWSLSALTFALHLFDCTILFEGVRDKWKKQLPLSEAWDVDFAFWKNKVWSVVIDTESFTTKDPFGEWKLLCDSDIKDFVAKANDCLDGNVPISEVLDFLKDKETGLSNVVLNMGKALTTVLADIDNIPTSATKEQFIDYFDSLMNIYLNENQDNPYPIRMGDDVISFEKWIASKTEKQRKKSVPSKLCSINSTMLNDKVWREVWEENVDLEQRFIDKEGFGREIFAKRKSIIEDDKPCGEILSDCFSSLALCTHLCDYLASQNEGAFDKLPEGRKEIIFKVEALIEKGEWEVPATIENMKAYLRQVLGVGKQALAGDDEKMSEGLWSLFESGQGERIRVTFQNLIGYFASCSYLPANKKSSSLNKMFYGPNADVYQNIDKGHPGSKGMPPKFKEILPLLNKYRPKSTN